LKFIYYNDFIIINNLKMGDSSVSPEERDAFMNKITMGDRNWPFGDDHSEETLGKTCRAVDIISKAVKMWLMSEKSKECERCEYRKTLSPWIYSSPCNRRVPMRLVTKYDMEHTVFGGAGFKCTIHICACDKSNVYAKDDCVCGEVCAMCNYGCTCPPGTP
jgi:hypothetical protein